MNEQVLTAATSNREFSDAMSAFQAGKLGDAERLFKAVLRAQPQHVEALNLLGVILGQLGLRWKGCGKCVEGR